ncbi:MAG: PAS domain S-box protein [Anaerolineales bacterium]|nr:PAS domain S-box protein [Anaerolineales bacterium]
MANETILVVEDNAIIAAHLQRILGGFGYKVPHTVTTGEAAISSVNENKPDLALIDIQLAGQMDGIDAARYMKSNFDIPVIFLTAFAEEERLEQAKTIEPYGYLVKPVQERELYATIEMAFEKHRLTTNLRESESRYRQLVEQIKAITYLDKMDEFSSSMFMSPQIEQLLGFPVEDWRTNNEMWVKVLHPEDRDFAIAENKRTNETGENFNLEYRMVAKDGHTVWVHDEAVLTYDKSGKPYAWHGILYDITERKHSEEALRESEERYRLLFNSTNDAIFVNPILPGDNFGKCAEVNDIACSMLGYEREELLNMTPYDLIWELDEKQYKEFIKNIQKTHYHLYETLLIGKTGVLIPVEINTHIFNLNDQTLALSMARDIRERKKTQEILREKDNFIYAVSESTPGLIYVYDIATKKNIYINKPIDSILGYSEEDNFYIENYFSSDHYHPDDQEKINNHLKKCIRAKDNELVTIEFRIKKKNGDYAWFSNRDRVFKRDDKGKPTQILGIAQDISQQKEDQEEKDALFEISQLLLESTSLDEIYNQLPQLLGERFRFSVAAIDLLDEYHKEIYTVGSYGFPTNSNGYRVSFDQSPAKKVIKTGKMISMPDLETYQQEYFKEKVTETLHAFTCAPILIQGKVFGTLSLADYNNRKDLPRIGKTLQLIANQFSQEIARKQAEATIAETQALLMAAIEQTPAGILIADLPDAKIRFASSTALNIRGESPAPLTGISYEQHSQNWQTYTPDGELYPADKSPLARAVLNGLTTQNEEVLIRRENGDVRWVLTNASPVFNNNGDMIAGMVVFTDITDRKISEEALQESERRISTLISNLPGMVYRCIKETPCKMVFISDGCKQLTGYDPEELLQNKNIVYSDLIHPDDRQRVMDELEQALDEQLPYELFYRILTANAEIKWVWEKGQGIKGKDDKITALEGFITDVSERMKAEEALQESRQMLQTVLDTIPVRVYWKDKKSVYMGCNHIFAHDAGLVSPEDIVGKNDFELAWLDQAEQYRIDDRVVSASGLPKLNYEELQSTTDDKLIWRQASKVPLRDAQGKVIGVLGTYEDITERKKAEEALRLSYEQTQMHLKRVTILHNIDKAITTHTDLRVMVDDILKNIIELIGVDAVALLVPSFDGKTMDLAAHTGFPDELVDNYSHLIDQFLEIETKAKNKASFISNSQTIGLKEIDGINLNTIYKSYATLPLLAKDQLKGILHIFSRQPIFFDSDWQNFLQALAMQTAIAIDNTEMFYKMEMTNMELSAAYEATIEGWSRALELRDKETKGHSVRVTDLTLRISTVMGVPPEDLIHVKRGVLLHDIGKMGIPDSILLKPGALTEDEWIVMRQHPLYAYQLLSPISYLHQAMDIPYCHHEKWDGNGYPRGLKAEEIPLPARIFAIVDVWDALCSDRPYRPAWTKKNAIEYIKKESGKHFDPAVVDAFLKVLKDELDL